MVSSPFCFLTNNDAVRCDGNVRTALFVGTSVIKENVGWFFQCIGKRIIGRVEENDAGVIIRLAAIDQDLILYRFKLHVLTDLFNGIQTETGMLFPDGYQLFDPVDDLMVFLFPRIVDHIDAVGCIVAVAHILFGPAEFLPGMEKRNSLGQ